MRNNVNHLNSPLVLQLHPLDQPASCSSLYTLFSFNGSDEYSARFWHTTNAITLYSSRTVGTAATQLEPSVTSANFIQFLDLPTDDDCLPGPTQCDFTVRATYCPGGYQGVSTVAVEGLTKVTCCPIDSGWGTSASSISITTTTVVAATETSWRGEISGSNRNIEGHTFMTTTVVLCQAPIQTASGGTRIHLMQRPLIAQYTTYSVPPGSTSSKSNSSGGPNTGGILAGMIIGIIAGVLLLSVGPWFLLRYLKRRKRMQKERDEQLEEGDPPEYSKAELPTDSTVEPKSELEANPKGQAIPELQGSGVERHEADTHSIHELPAISQPVEMGEKDGKDGKGK